MDFDPLEQQGSKSHALLDYKNLKNKNKKLRIVCVYFLFVKETEVHCSELKIETSIRKEIYINILRMAFPSLGSLPANHCRVTFQYTRL